MAEIIDLALRRRDPAAARLEWAERVAAKLLTLLDEDLRIDYSQLGRFLQRVGRRGRGARDVLELRALLLNAQRLPSPKAKAPLQGQLPLPLAPPPADRPRRGRKRSPPSS